MGQDDGAGGLQNVINGYPILPGRFHAHILAMVVSQPDSAPPQFVGKCRESFAFVRRNAMVVGCGNTRYDKAFVNIDPAANWVNDFEHNTSPQNSI